MLSKVNKVNGNRNDPQVTNNVTFRAESAPHEHGVRTTPKFNYIHMTVESHSSFSSGIALSLLCQNMLVHAALRERLVS